MSYTSPQIPQALRGLSYAISKKIFLQNIRKSSKITVTSMQLTNFYKMPEKKVHVIPNGVDYNLFYKKKSDFRYKNGLDKFFVIGFVGVLREWLDIEPFFDALVELVPKYPIKVVIAGNGVCFKRIKKNVSSRSLDDCVIFTGTVSYSDLPDVINSFDVGIIPFNLGLVSQHAIPLKLFEYFACELPVFLVRLRVLRYCLAIRFCMLLQRTIIKRLYYFYTLIVQKIVWENALDWTPLKRTHGPI
jgi:glycosyltransferase involved in cell wall biosynthesis